jgi:MFS transporter, MHS family, citrate/tricarballylate:H+ symporter
MVVFLTEIMPVSIRTTGFSFAYNCATAAFGGFSTYLIHRTGSPAAPSLWLSFAAVCGLIAALILSPRHRARIAAPDRYVVTD